jgi:proprotein convertase subtilisin/kexin type 5
MATTWGNAITRMCINSTASCQAGTWGDNFTNLCTNLCSSNSSNSQLFYGENTTRLCVPSCPVPTFAFIQTRVCIDICPVTVSNTPGFFGDPGTTPTRLCVTACLTGGLYRDVANNRTCQPTCTFNSTYKTYQDPTTMTCVGECPSYPQSLFAWGTNSSTASCIFPCTTGYMDDASRSCVANCSNLLDPTTNTCVSICPDHSALNTTLYANLVTKTCVIATACPDNTYASDDHQVCVSTCPNNTYIYQKHCLNTCPDGFYINFLTQSCVNASSCPTDYFANNQTRSCVASCSNGTFGDSLTRMCITTCYGANFADPITGLCSTSCSSGLIKNSLTFSCVGNCQPSYFYNPNSASCTTSCQ